MQYFDDHFPKMTFFYLIKRLIAQLFNWQHNWPKTGGLEGWSMRKSFLFTLFLIAGGSSPCLILVFFQPFNGLFSFFRSILAILVAVLDVTIFSHKTTAWTKVVLFLCSYCVCPCTQIWSSHSLHRRQIISQPGLVPGVSDGVPLDRSTLALTTCCWSGAVERPACSAIALWLRPVKIRFPGFDPPVGSARQCKCIDLIPYLLPPPPPPFLTSTLRTCRADWFWHLPGSLT